VWDALIYVALFWAGVTLGLSVALLIVLIAERFGALHPREGSTPDEREGNGPYALRELHRRASGALFPRG
jgi:hypothetical protein